MVRSRNQVGKKMKGWGRDEKLRQLQDVDAVCHNLDEAAAPGSAGFKPLGISTLVATYRGMTSTIYSGHEITRYLNRIRDHGVPIKGGHLPTLSKSAVSTLNTLFAYQAFVTGDPKI